MGEVNGVKGVWGHVKGGMGAVSQAIARAAEEAGAEIFTNASVAAINVHNGRVCGVTLDGGDTVDANHVVSNADPMLTMLDLIDEKELPERVVTHFKKNWNCEPASTKVCRALQPAFLLQLISPFDGVVYFHIPIQINVALDRLPNFTCVPNVGDSPMPHHRCTTHFEDSVDQV